MLRSTLQRWPNASLIRTSGGFGVRLPESDYLYIVWSGPWTDADMRDLLALFATWLATDPDRLRGERTSLSGVSLGEFVQSAPSNGRQE